MPPREEMVLVADVVQEDVRGYHGEELYPCRFCGSTGQCEHLMRVIHVDDGNGGERPIPIRAELGPEWGRRRMVQLVGELAQVYLQSRPTGSMDGTEEKR